MHRLEVKLSGGLGNQLFQYYAGLSIAKLQGRRLVLNLTDVARSHSEHTIQSFQVEAEFKKQRIKRFLRSRIDYMSKLESWTRKHSSRHLIDINYEQNLIQASERSAVSISGYFQDFRYMSNYQTNPLKLKNTSKKLEQLETSLSGEITLAVHVRRGDFLGQSKSHGCVAADWYIRVILTLIENHSEIRKIVLFSDDIEWVTQNIIKKIHLRNIEVIFNASTLKDPAESWFLITQANFIVCANSTFSLSAAYFSKAEVIVPWPLTKNENFKDLSKTLPNEWTLATTTWE